MSGHVRVSLAAALVLLVAHPASAAAQQRQCTAADSARVSWTPPPGVSDGTWRAALLADSLVAPETELVKIPWDSLPELGAFDQVSELHGELDREVRARVGEGPAEVMLLARVEPDSTMSRLLLVRSSGVVGLEESAGGTLRRLRFYPALVDGCPIASWYPIIVTVLPPVSIPRRGSPER
jgi:hypothetical protein